MTPETPVADRMETGGRRRANWPLRLSVALFLLSFVLPAVRLGGPEDRSAIGLLAAFFSATILPHAIRAYAADSPASPAVFGDSLHAILVGVYFLILVVQNGTMLLAVGPLRGRRLGRRLATAAAILVWGVPFVDYGRLYGVLGLVDGDAVHLDPGFFVWAISFALLAVGLRRERASESSRGDSRER